MVLSLTTRNMIPHEIPHALWNRINLLQITQQDRNLKSAATFTLDQLISLLLRVLCLIFELAKILLVNTLKHQDKEQEYSCGRLFLCL